MTELEPLVLVARTEQEGLDWLAFHDIKPDAIHIVTDVDGFREKVDTDGLRWRLAGDDEGDYFKMLPEPLQREMDRWLFHHPEKAERR